MQAHPPLAVGCAQVSPPLPGGYKVGEKVFFTGEGKTWDDGDKRMHGQQGEVVGPTTTGKGVLVRFPGNKDNIGCNLTQVRRLYTAAPRCHPPLGPHAHATLPTPGAPALLRPPLPCCPNPCCKRSRASAVAQRL